MLTKRRTLGTIGLEPVKRKKLLKSKGTKFDFTKVWDLPIAEINKQCARGMTQTMSLQIEIPVNGGSNKPNLTFYSMPTGCGLYAMYGTVYFSSPKFTKEQLEKISKDLDKATGRYTVIATLGDSWTNQEKSQPNNYAYQKNLEAVGFRKLAEYPHKGHGKGRTQTIYIREVAD